MPGVCKRASVDSARNKIKGEAIKEKWGLAYIDIFVDDKHENHLDVVKSLVCGFNMAPRFGFSTVSLEPYVRFYHPPIVNEEKGKVDFARVLLGCITNKCAAMTPLKANEVTFNWGHNWEGGNKNA